MRYRSLSTSTLRATLATLAGLGVLSKQRQAIRIEIASRELADAIECRMHEWSRWMRGGLS